MGIDTLISEIELAPNIIDTLQEGLVVVDTDGIIRYCSPQFLELTRLSEDELRGRHVFNELPFEAPDQKAWLLEDSLETGEPRNSTGVKYDHEPDERYVNIRISPQSDAAVISFMDVTTDVKSAIIDGLTGAYSQNHYRRGLKERAIAEAQRTSGKYLGVIGFDLKGLKKTNDERSHAEGDILLIELVKILQEAVRETDYVVRDGGDEFLVLGPGANEEGIKRITGKVNGLVDAYNDQVTDPLLRMKLYMTGAAGDSNYETLFTQIEQGINSQKRSSK